MAFSPAVSLILAWQRSATRAHRQIIDYGHSGKRDEIARADAVGSEQLSLTEQRADGSGGEFFKNLHEDCLGTRLTPSMVALTKTSA